MTVEEHVIHGGLGSAVAEIIAEAGFPSTKRFKRIGIPDRFPEQYGSQNSLMAHYGLTTEQVVATVQALHNMNMVC